VTALGAGLESGGGVTHAGVLEVCAQNIAYVRERLVATVAGLPSTDDGCTCRHALDGQRLPFDLP
jgi:5'-methylthioadenosine phosphorylase